MSFNSLNPRIFVLQSVDSTNNYAKNLIATNRPPEGTVILSQFQSAGRGLDKNSWESQPGKNITCSFILYPVFLNIDKQIQLNKAISLAIIDFIKNINPILNAKIKWPNDIYINDKKIAGILIENSISGSNFNYSVIGIGININQNIFISDAPNPSSLMIETGKSFNLFDCLNDLILFVDRRYNMIKNKNFSSIDSDYLFYLYRFGEIHSFMAENKIFSAKLAGVNNFGKLMLLLNDNSLRDFDVKEVSFII